MFAHFMKWWDDPFMVSIPAQRRPLQLAIYSWHLASGTNLFCRRLKSNTIKEYCAGVAAIVLYFTHGKIDPRKNEQQTEFDPLLSNVFKELERWEKVPDRREPWTLEMMDCMTDTSVFGAHSPDSAWSACIDWFRVGLQLGYRLSEWAQCAGHTDLGSQATIEGIGPTAVCLNDITFVLKSRRHIPARDIPAHPVDDITDVLVTFRWQKNHNLNEVRRLRGTVIHAWHRIVLRWLRLVPNHDTSVPLAVFRDAPSGRTQFLTSRLIEHTMRRVAAHVYNLDPNNKRDAEALKRWSSHSLRVGACNLLHDAGFNISQIQHLLRWKSDAFRVYLRNTILLAQQQARVLDQPDSIPDLTTL